MAAALTSLVLVVSYRFQSEAAGYREAFAAVPAEVRLLNLPLDPYSDLFTAHPFVHYDKLIVVDRPVALSDVWAYPGSALYPIPDNPIIDLPASYKEADLQFIDWPAYRLDEWDYVLIRTKPSAAAPGHACEPRPREARGRLVALSDGARRLADVVLASPGGRDAATRV